MTTESTARPVISFSLPEGRLDLAAPQLDAWAEHLTACYRALGVTPGDAIGIVDYGSSPVAYLSSSLVTAGLRRGVAELLSGSVICVDASHERVGLVPGILPQVELDVVVVRLDVVPLLMAVLRESGMSLAGLRVLVTVRLGARGAELPLPSTTWHRLLVVESAMLIAPECRACGGFHLDDDRYDVDLEERTVTARDVHRAHRVGRRVSLLEGGCAALAGRWRLVDPPEPEVGR